MKYILTNSHFNTTATCIANTLEEAIETFKCTLPLIVNTSNIASEDGQSFLLNTIYINHEEARDIISAYGSVPSTIRVESQEQLDAWDDAEYERDCRKGYYDDDYEYNLREHNKKQFNKARANYTKVKPLVNSSLGEQLKVLL